MEIPSFTFIFCICNKNYYIIGNFPFPGVNYILHDKYLFQLFNDMYMLLRYILSSHYDIHLWNCCVIISFHGWSIFYGSWRCNFVKKKKPFGTKIIMCLLISWHKRGQWYLWKVNCHGFLWFHINVYVIFNSHKFRRNSTIAYHHNPSGCWEPLLKLLLITERQDQLTSKQDKVLNRIKDVYIKYSEYGKF